jgi:hypothetical protein
MRPSISAVYELKVISMRTHLPPVVLLLLLAGCAQSVAPVSGRITLDEKPLANATVTFQPISEDANPGPGSQGKTDSNGQFTLKLMNKENTIGAVVGKHKVSITAYDGDDKEIPSSGSDMKPFRKRIVPAAYNAKSTLTFDVPAGGTASANFDLKSEP